MKKIATVWMIAGIIGLHAATAQAGFTPPTAEQIAAAAENPTDGLADMLSEASAEQAAEVVKLLLATVLQQGLDNDAQLEKITDIVRAAMRALPLEVEMSFAEALGTALANASGISLTPEAISAIQGGLASGVIGGYSVAFLTSYQNNLPQGGTGQTSSTEPPPIQGSADPGTPPEPEPSAPTTPAPATPAPTPASSYSGQE